MNMDQEDEDLNNGYNLSFATKTHLKSHAKTSHGIRQRKQK